MKFKPLTKKQALHNLKLSGSQSTLNKSLHNQYKTQLTTKPPTPIPEVQTNEKITYTEYASINPNYTAYYFRRSEKAIKDGSRPKIEIPKRTDNRKFKRLQNSLNYLLMTSPKQNVYCKIQKKHFRFKLNFITLTLSEKQKHTDKEIKELLLEPFCKWIIYEGATGYVWKAETQDNGNLHFHITTNKFIHYQSLRDKWNYLQYKNGYLDNYEKAHGDTNANSTDIKAVVNVKKAMQYMFKYLLKKDTRKKSCSLFPEDLTNEYTKAQMKTTTDKDGYLWEMKRDIDGHDYGYSRNLANIKLIIPTTHLDFKEIEEYLLQLKPFQIEFDFVRCIYHELIDIDKCPATLRKLIFEQMT